VSEEVEYIKIVFVHVKKLEEEIKGIKNTF
jgi:hypothetical protein